MRCGLVEGFDAWAEAHPAGRPAMKVALFVPCYVDAFFPEVGIATLELLERLGCEVDKGGASRVAAGKACVSCHDETDAEKELGDKLVQAGPLEPVPVAGKPGHVDLAVQAAYDDRNAYLRFQWKT